MPTTTRERRPIAWWLPFAELAVAALWLAWAFAPPPVSSFTAWWFDLIAVPAVVACMVGAAAVAMWRGVAPRGALAWIGLTALGVILVLHAFFLWIVWTFPADF